MNTREIIAAVFVLAAPVGYFFVTESSAAALYQTTAEHLPLLAALPVGLVVIWLIERRPPSAGQRATPAWARLLLGGAAGFLLATAVLLLNSAAAGTPQELKGTSQGVAQTTGITAVHAVVRLEDGRTVHLRNAFCGVNGAPVTVYMAKGLLGLDRLIACNVPSVRPGPGDLEKLK